MIVEVRRRFGSRVVAVAGGVGCRCCGGPAHAAHGHRADPGIHRCAKGVGGPGAARCRGSHGRERAVREVRTFPVPGPEGVRLVPEVPLRPQIASPAPACAPHTRPRPRCPRWGCFREQQYGRGLVAGAARIISRIAEGRGVKLTEAPAGTPANAPAQGRRSTNFSDGVRVLLFILFVIFMMSRRSRRRGRHWGGGSWSGWNSGVGPFGGGMGGFGGGFGGFGGGGGGGGFGGFGGGRSGGGGASGGW